MPLLRAGHAAAGPLAAKRGARHRRGGNARAFTIALTGWQHLFCAIACGFGAGNPGVVLGAATLAVADTTLPAGLRVVRAAKQMGVRQARGSGQTFAHAVSLVAGHARALARNVATDAIRARARHALVGGLTGRSCWSFGTTRAHTAHWIAAGSRPVQARVECVRDLHPHRRITGGAIDAGRGAGITAHRFDRRTSRAWIAPRPEDSGSKGDQPGVADTDAGGEANCGNGHEGAGGRVSKRAHGDSLAAGSVACRSHRAPF